LSVGMSLRLVGSPAGSLMHAQGRFKTVLILNACYAAAFLSAVTAGAYVADGTGVAIAASAYFAILGPVHMYVAIRPGGGRWRDVLDVYAVPVCASAAALAPAMWLMEQIPAGPVQQWLRIGTVPLVTGSIYVILVRLVAHERLRELFVRLGHIPMIG